MTAGSDLVFDHLSHNHIEPRAEYQFFGDVLLVHSLNPCISVNIKQTLPLFMINDFYHDDHLYATSFILVLI